MNNKMTRVGTAQALAEEFPATATDLVRAAREIMEEGGERQLHLYTEGPLRPIYRRCILGLSVLREWETPGVPEFLLTIEEQNNDTSRTSSMGQGSRASRAGIQ